VPRGIGVSDPREWRVSSWGDDFAVSRLAGKNPHRNLIDAGNFLFFAAPLPSPQDCPYLMVSEQSGIPRDALVD
jgi:hypothetical protein